MSNYTMPRYFQNMQVLNVPAAKPNPAANTAAMYSWATNKSSKINRPTCKQACLRLACFLFALVQAASWKAT